MLIFPIAFTVGIALGRLRGGSVRSLSNLRLRLPGLVVLAVLLQVVTDAVGVTTGVRSLDVVASYGLLGVCLVVNLGTGSGWRRGGFACVAIGYALNLLVIAPNGSMPVSTVALHQAGGSQAALHKAVNLDKHVAAGRKTVWPWLGDVIAIRSFRAVISVGDIAMLVGVVVVLSEAMVAVEEISSDKGFDVEKGGEMGAERTLAAPPRGRRRSRSWPFGNRAPKGSPSIAKKI